VIELKLASNKNVVGQRRNKARTRAISSGIEKGLTTKSSAPAEKLRRRRDSSPRAESMMIGTVRVASSARNRIQISGPDMPASIQSRMTRSGGASASFLTASSPRSTLSTT
jgi:hypothetical protein